MLRNQLREISGSLGAHPFLRLVVPVAVISLAKFSAGLFLYFLLGMGFRDAYWMTVSWGGEGQNDLLVLGANQAVRWPYLFIGWDGAWYLSILAKGYAFSSQSYAFFPGLPLFSWLLNLIGNNPLVSLASFSFVAGIAWLPVYQLVAESYMSRSDAMRSTLVYGFLPYVFLFSTVAYAEGLFLLATLMAWYFFRRNRILCAGVSASVAAIARPPGILIMMPIFVEVFKRYRFRRKLVGLRYVCSLALPTIGLVAWLYYCEVSLGSWLAPFTRASWSQMYSLFTLMTQTIFGNGVQGLLADASVQVGLSNLMWTAPLMVSLIAFLLLSPVLIRVLSGYDESLAMYSAAYVLGLLAFGSLWSLPRFLSFLPFTWMFLTPKIFKTKSKTLVVMTCVAFYCSAIILWYGFLTGVLIA